MRHCKARLLPVPVRSPGKGAGIALAIDPYHVRRCDPPAAWSQLTNKESDVAQSWKAVCRIRDISLYQAHLVQRGLAWQELPGVEVFRTEDDNVVARLEGGAKHFSVRVEGDKVYLDQDELNAPASRAEAALAGLY
jgi:nitrite reductase (NADH) small subunit